MLRKKQVKVIKETKRKLNRAFPVLLLGFSCMFAGIGAGEACTEQTQMAALQMPVSDLFLAEENGQAVLSAFRQNETTQGQTEQASTDQTGSGTASENTSASSEVLQEKKTVSGNTISALEIELAAELNKAWEQVNQARKEIGLGELVWNEELADAAGIRAEEIYTTFSHTRPDGSEWWSVNEDIVYGENLARGYQSADSVMKAWLDSTEHKDNILYSGFTTIGIAVYEVDGKWYWVQEFGY
ncbi:MAG: CAP domain-containing protein [Ruminococcus sp.]|nr:CAP domain-containing protein [Ruminococcus sp.]